MRGGGFCLIGRGMTATEKLLCELIALPTVNPAFLPAGDARAGESRAREFLACVGAQAGLDIEFQEVVPGRANLLARLTPAGKVRQRILLAPHLDTLNAAEEAFQPSKRSGRIYGRGACDTKGSVAAMFSALCELGKGSSRPRETEIVFAGLIDEENAQLGSRALARSGFRADLAIVGEPTRNHVVTAHKGSMWVRLETRGKSAHGSRPDLGRNAIRLMAQIVEALETEYASRLQRKRHALLGSPTINVGVITGGSQANIVPDHCAISADRRTLPGETVSGVRREIVGFLAGKGLRAALGNDKAAPCPPLETDPSLPLISQLLSCLGQRAPAGADYFCDASVLAQGGIPSVVYGPGDIAQAHTADEWISTASLERARAGLFKFLRTLP